jgi:ribosomal protein L32
MKAAQDLASVRHLLVQQGQLEAHTLFECSACGERQLGQRRCHACGHFCRASGLAAACTACGEFLLLIDLFVEEVPPLN